MKSMSMSSTSFRHLGSRFLEVSMATWIAIGGHTPCVVAGHTRIARGRAAASLNAVSAPSTRDSLNADLIAWPCSQSDTGPSSTGDR